MKNTLKGILIIIVAALVLIIGVPKVINFVKYMGVDDTEHYDAMYTKEDIEANYDKIPSDIDGWTMGDKIRAGLQPIEGVDSDADGLTDKEEIEIYGSDPAKTSTAGDLYTDGYKVENGMDINTSYDRDDVSFDGNECSEITLSALSAEDMFAHVSQIDTPTIKGYETYKAYDLYSYGSTVSIDVSDIVSDDISPKDITILIGHWYGGEMWSEKQSVSGNVITPDYAFDHNNRYTIVVAKKNGIFSPSKPSLDFSLNSDDGDIEYSKDVNFLYTHTLAVRNLFTNAKPRLYYVPTGDTKTDQNTINYLLAISAYAVDGYGLEGLSDADVKEVSETKMAALKAVTSMLPSFELTKTDPDPGFQSFLYMWNDEVILDSNDYKAEVSDVQNTSSSHTGFNVNEDAFPFPNFSTEYANGGNCAGISYFTAKLFNEGSMPASGSYSSDRYSNGAGSISWDISGDSSNDTLTDKVIFDYKDSHFVKNHKGDSKLLTGLSSGEAEFVKMMGAYWGEANDAMRPEDKLYAINDTYGVYSWETIKKIEQKLDNGEILILGLASSTGGGHAVNIVDYRTADDGDTVYFILYDNEYPQNAYKGIFNDNYLKVTRKACAEGETDSFTFYYKPYKSCKYEYNSEYSEVGYKLMVVMDSDMNIIE